MFSGVLLDVLERGSPELPERFSLADLGLTTDAMIQERFIDAAVRPQVISPDQTVGDIAKLAIFPNLGLGVKSIREDLHRIEVQVSNLVRAQEAMAVEHSSFKARLDDLGSATTSALNSTSPEDPDRGFDESLLFKFPWLKSTGLTKAQWDIIPGPVKIKIISHQKRIRNGKYWLLACYTLVASSWFFSIMALVSARGSLISDLFNVISVVLTVICGFMAFLQIIVSMRGRLWLAVNEASPPASDTEIAQNWRNYDVVIEADNYDWRDVFGLEIEKNALSLSQLIYLVTFIGTIMIRFLPQFLNR